MSLPVYVVRLEGEAERLSKKVDAVIRLTDVTLTKKRIDTTRSRVTLDCTVQARDHARAIVRVEREIRRWTAAWSTESARVERMDP